MGRLPDDLETGNTTPSFKKERRTKNPNYQFVSRTAIVGKIMKSVLKEAVYQTLIYLA